MKFIDGKISFSPDSGDSCDKLFNMVFTPEQRKAHAEDAQISFAAECYGLYYRDKEYTDEEDIYAENFYAGRMDVTDASAKRGVSPIVRLFAARFDTFEYIFRFLHREASVSEIYQIEKILINVFENDNTPFISGAGIRADVEIWNKKRYDYPGAHTYEEEKEKTEK